MWYDHQDHRLSNTMVVIVVLHSKQKAVVLWFHFCLRLSSSRFHFHFVLFRFTPAQHCRSMGCCWKSVLGCCWALLWLGLDYIVLFRFLAHSLPFPPPLEDIILLTTVHYCHLSPNYSQDYESASIIFIRYRFLEKRRWRMRLWRSKSLCVMVNLCRTLYLHYSLCCHLFWFWVHCCHYRWYCLH